MIRKGDKMELTEKMNFTNEIKEGVVLVDFFATWCGPCRMLIPVLDELDSSREDIKIIKVNVDQNIELAQQYNVHGVPYLVLFKDGQKVAETSGFRPKEALEQWIDQNR